MLFFRLLRLPGTTETSRSEQKAGNNPATACKITGLLFSVLAPHNLVWIAGELGLGKAQRREPESALEIMCSPHIMRCSSSSSVGRCLLKAFGDFSSFVPPVSSL